ncbi:MAG: hypothetical protein HRT61_07425 [Ekhidna sp.]|nr:hypothetical protein [Ekhidna sp.]
MVISFIESKEPSPQFGHLGIRVSTEEELKERKKNVESLLTIELEETNSACCYALQNKFWVKDPDGYEWEVYHFLQDSESMGGRTKSTKGDLVACC